MKRITFLILTEFIFWAASAQADMSQIKVYKNAFNPDNGPKCIDCHVDKMPKKDGAHELNDYGKAVAKAAGTNSPTADHYKSVGTIEDFAKKAATK